MAKTIYVLNGLAHRTAPAYAAANLRPVLGTPDEVAEWQAFTRAAGWPGEAALHVDTGMNRLGMSFAEAEALAAQILPDEVLARRLQLDRREVGRTTPYPLLWRRREDSSPAFFLGIGTPSRLTR